MCGIAGIVNNAENLTAVRGMTAALRHRGPDGEGYISEFGMALGHRRLSILDLSSAGAQPMRSRDGRFTISFNGEIFNYRELRAELEGQFRSSTDTEVLLEACSVWGAEKAAERSNGMFAFALWDSRERELMLVRDRSGEKPLVYFWDGTTFAFASELKALAGLHSSRLNPAAVDAYLALGYVPAPLAIFLDCHKVPPGHVLRFRDGQITVRRWWFPELAPAQAGGSEASKNRAGELRSLVADAVRLRLRSDVPVALSLSGGVDSSAIAVECAAQGGSLGAFAPEAFTVVFAGEQIDLPHARAVASHLNLRHHVIEVPSPAAAHQLDLASTHYDEPFADSSALPSLALAAVLGGRYKVILNGDGGDEAFAGYPHYEYIAAKQVLKGAAASAGFADGSGGVDVYVQSKTVFRLRERSQLLSEHTPDSTLAELLAADSYLPHAPKGALHRALWSDRHLYLANNLTYKTDIALAAFGMEGRAPFLDHRILEWAQGLDSNNLVRGREKKVLLREAYREALPATVLDRPKHGFGAPIESWMAGPLRGTIRESLPCPLLDLKVQQRAEGQRLWTLLTFARWAQRWGARW